jgi:hypothetical protein
MSRIPKRIAVRTASQLLQLFWPDFIEVDGCVFAAFQCSGGPINELSDGKTETECFINHTHIFDEFRNRATSKHREAIADDFDVVEEFYDPTHPDFAAACEVGLYLARMWTLKLKAEFPHERFRVYYTQYDNPIVRFHKVRSNERAWLSDDQLKDATDPSFASAVIYDTDYIDNPVVKMAIKPN